MKTFISRMAWYALLFGILLQVLIPLTAPLLISANVWIWTGKWNGWQTSEALYILLHGLPITPFAAFLFALGEYGQSRGWWK